MGKVHGQRLQAIAAKHAPKGITIRYKRGPRLTPAHACLADADMLVPRPNTREALYIFLHECAHFHLKHFSASSAPTRELWLLYTGNGELEPTVEEYEAEQWTIATMRREGIAVPRSMIRAAKKYVRELGRCSKKRVPAHVKRFARRAAT